MTNNIIIDIVMVTYNHEKYIKQAIKSVLAQKTKYKFRLIIGEDASTDQTLSICERYAEKYPDLITLLKSKINVGIIKNYKRCFEYCDSKYVCILEGDDFWNNPKKLEKQVELMQSDADIGLAHANFILYNESKNKYNNNSRRLVKYCIEKQEYIYEQLIWNNFICPLTVMFKRELLNDIDYDYLIKKNLLTIDYFLWLNFSLRTKIIYENETYGVYRVSSNSISNNSSFAKRIEFITTNERIIDYYLCRHPVNNFTVATLRNRSNMRLLFRAIKTRNFKYSSIYIKKISISGIVGILKKHFKYYKR